MKVRKQFVLGAGAAACVMLSLPLSAQTPSPQPAPGTAERDGAAAKDGEATTPQQDAGQPRRKPPRRPPAPRRDGPPDPEPPELELAPSDEDGPESILDEIDDYGPAGDLAPQDPLFDELTIEFNKAVAECDLKKFLEVRERYLAEIRRILSKPNLDRRARAHFERVLNAVLETMVPIRAPLPCPLLIR